MRFISRFHILQLAAIQTQLTWMADRDPRAKNAKPEQFIDGSFLKEIEKSGFVAKLYQK